MSAKFWSPAKWWWRTVLESFRRDPVSAFVSAVAALLAVLVMAVAVVVFAAWLGLYNVAATQGHNALFGWFLHFVMRHSVQARAVDQTAPPLDNPILIARGQRYADLRCSPCHGAPGRAPDKAAHQLLPPPPLIEVLGAQFTPNQLHWIIKNGVKMSAMPPWSSQKRDDEIWALVAYLERLRKNGREVFLPVEQRAGLGGTVTLGTCFACHGRDGNGQGGIFPKLARLSSEYIQGSLEDYRTSRRPSGFMQPFAFYLNPEEIKKFADYFGALTNRSSQDLPPAERSAVSQGAQIAETAKSTRAEAACQTCHVRENQSLFPDIPDIAGQPADYIATQLKLFRSGERSGSSNAEVMVRIARGLSDVDIANVAAYFASLGNGRASSTPNLGSSQGTDKAP